MTQNATEMPVFCDVSPEKQIEGLKEFFISKQAKFSQNLNNEDVSENLNELIKNLDCLYSSEIPENDLEMVLNSIVSVIVVSTVEKISKLVTTFCESIVKAQLADKFGIVKLRVLSNLFHGLIATSKDRYTVYIHLARCSANIKNLTYLPYKLEIVKKYLQLWSTKIEDIQALYRVLFEALAQVNDSQNALKTINELLGTYSKENASKSREDAHKCIVYCINDANIFIFDSLLLLEPIKYLEGELIHNLLTIFVSGKLTQYMDFYDAHKSFITQSGMNHEKNINKMRILTFMSLGENNKVITFDLLQHHLNIEPAEVESFVIDAIRTKCIRCKIDQLGRTVTVMSIGYRTFNKQHWQSLKEKLEKWKENLLSVNQNLSTLLSQSSILPVN